MFRTLQDNRAIRFAVCGALAAGLVACAGSGHLAKASARTDQSIVKATGKLDRAVAKAEDSVQHNPRDAAARAALGNAYLDAGRFDSAAVTFQDAVSLGDASAGTALRLALAQIGAGRNNAAIAVLDRNRDAIPASDLGLALALAGETGRGIDVLADALRGGEDTPKVRQNLAYAYALDGRWAEARLMASQDVPADRIDDRIGEWAVKGRPEDYQRRVASTLGVPVRPDAGQPAALALGEWPATSEPTKFAAAPAPAEALPSGELPASDPSREFAIAEAAAPVAAVPVATSAPVTADRPSPSYREPTTFADAFAASPPAVFRPVRARAVVAGPVVAAKPRRGGSHLVQLGSFSSPENARRAIKILRARNPELKGFEMAITPAVVRGKNFWRVAASGFNQASAFGLCSKVRTRGGGCIAYSSHRPLPGAAPLRGGSGPMLARR